MLPPPTTMATSTPASITSFTCLATLLRMASSIPKSRLPMRASPLNFSRMRLYFAEGALILLQSSCQQTRLPQSARKRESAADAEDLSRDLVRIRGGQEQRHLRDVVRPVGAEWHPFLRLLEYVGHARALLRCRSLIARRVPGNRGANRVDAYLGAGQLHGHHLGHEHYGRRRPADKGFSSGRRPSRIRSHDDDFTRLPGHHVVQHRPHSIEAGEEVATDA